MSTAPKPLTMTDWHSASIAIPVEQDARDRRLAELQGEVEDQAAEIERLQQQLAKTRALIRQLVKIEAKAAKADMLADDPKDLILIGLSQTLDGIRTKCKLFLLDYPGDRT